MFKTLKQKITHWALNQISDEDPVELRLQKYRLLVEDAFTNRHGTSPFPRGVSTNFMLDDNYDTVAIVKILNFAFHAKITVDSPNIAIDMQMMRSDEKTALFAITTIIVMPDMLDFYQIDGKSIRYASDLSGLPSRHPRFEQDLVNNRLLPLMRRLIAIQTYLDFRETRVITRINFSQSEYATIAESAAETCTAKGMPRYSTRESSDTTASRFQLRTKILQKCALDVRAFENPKAGLAMSNSTDAGLRPAPEWNPDLTDVDLSDDMENAIKKIRDVSKSLFGEAEPVIEGPVVDIYNLDDIRKIDARVALNAEEVTVDDETDRKHHKIVRAFYLRGAIGAKRRLAPATREQIERFAAIEAKAPHLSELATRIRLRLELSEKTQTPLYIPPTLLNGPPGNSKTWFFQRLAEALDLPFFRQPMSTSSLSESFVGSDVMWKGSRQGIVARALLESDAANPIIFVDEFDKASSNNHNQDPYRPFLPLLERENASSFADEYVRFPIDASHVIWVFTANSTALLPDTIIDRLTIIDAPAMTIEQKKQILRSTYAEKVAHYRDWHAKALSEPVLAKLAELSLRHAMTAIDDTLASSAANNRREPIIADIPAPKTQERFKPGFM